MILRAIYALGWVFCELLKECREIRCYSFHRFKGMMAVKELISKAQWEPRASDHGSLLLLGEPLEPGISQVSHSYHYDCQLEAGVPCDVGKCICI